MFSSDVRSDENTSSNTIRYCYFGEIPAHVGRQDQDGYVYDVKIPYPFILVRQILRHYLERMLRILNI